MSRYVCRRKAPSRVVASILLLAAGLAFSNDEPAGPAAFNEQGRYAEALAREQLTAAEIAPGPESLEVARILDALARAPAKGPAHLALVRPPDGAAPVAVVLGRLRRGRLALTGGLERAFRTKPVLNPA